MSTETKCPRCQSEKFQSLQGCSVCASCNYTDVAAEFEGDVIPKWVLPYVGVDRSFLVDLAEINSGKYGPGYVSVIPIPEGNSEEKPVVKRVRWSRPDRLKILMENRREPKAAANY